MALAWSPNLRAHLPIAVVVAAGSAVAVASSMEFRQPFDNVDAIAARVFTARCAGVPVFAPHDFAPFLQTPLVYDVPDCPIFTNAAQFAAPATGPGWPAHCNASGYPRMSATDPADILAVIEGAGLAVEVYVVPSRAGPAHSGMGGVAFLKQSDGWASPARTPRRRPRR